MSPFSFNCSNKGNGIFVHAALIMILSYGNTFEGAVTLSVVHA